MYKFYPNSGYTVFLSVYSIGESEDELPKSQVKLAHTHRLKPLSSSWRAYASFAGAVIKSTHLFYLAMIIVL